MTLLQVTAPQSWTLVSALIAGLTAQAGVIVLLWRAYTTAQGKYEKRLEQNVTELVPVVIEYGAQTKAMHTSAQRLLEAAIRLERERHPGGPDERPPA